MDKVELLYKATKAYDEGHPIMSDKEWDDLYFAVKAENPDAADTITHEVVNELQKVEHNHSMLSLAKTKDINEFKSFIGEHHCVLMPKYDGLSCSLLYKHGKLVRAETRGNGLIGEDVTHNAMVIPSIPKTIDDDSEEFVVDGEVICREDIFQEKFADKYSNPRNFVAGSLRLLDSKECKNRGLEFWAWALIKSNKKTNSFSSNISYLFKLGFNTVCLKLDKDILDYFIDLIRTGWHNESHVPIDGVVIRYDDEEYAASLGSTAHHPRGAFAFKFYDETYSTKLRNIEWTMGRLGTLTPVAIFDPIEIEGAIINRANLHNISIMRELLGDMPYDGQNIEVYRSNMIIPQIYSADKEIPEDTIIKYFEVPKFCPFCNSELEVKKDNDSEVLYCDNPECESNLIVRLDHFAGKKGMDIKGLSRATLEKLIGYGWINSAIDIYSLKDHKDEWIKMPGFGKKSVENILAAIEKSKDCTLTAFISALGIPLVGPNMVKELVKKFNTYADFRAATDFFDIPSFGVSRSESVRGFDYSEADKIAELLNFKQEEDNENDNSSVLNGLTFVITGSLNEFKNRAELKSFIEKNGGKVSNSITAKTSYLINNDINSASAKNITAKEKNIPIISEKEFKNLFAF